MQTAWKYILVSLLALAIAGLSGCNRGGSSTDLGSVPGDPASDGGNGGETFIDEPTGGPLPDDGGGSGGEDDGGSDDGGGGSDGSGGGDSGGDDGGGGEDPGDPVPEPTTMFLIGSGLASLAYYGKRRRNGEDVEDEEATV